MRGCLFNCCFSCSPALKLSKATTVGWVGATSASNGFSRGGAGAFSSRAGRPKAAAATSRATTALVAAHIRYRRFTLFTSL